MHAALDVQLLDAEVSDVDLGRLEAWARQTIVDAASDDAAGVLGDLATLETLRDRMELDAAAGAAIDAARAAADSDDLAAVAEALAGLT